MSRPKIKEDTTHMRVRKTDKKIIDEKATNAGISSPDYISILVRK
jgi:hypothetical protein